MADSNINNKVSANSPNGIDKSSSNNPSIVRTALNASDKVENISKKAVGLNQNDDERFIKQSSLSDNAENEKFHKVDKNFGIDEIQPFSKTEKINEEDKPFEKSNKVQKNKSEIEDDDKPFKRSKNESFVKGDDNNAVEKGVGKIVDTAIQVETGGVVGGREDIARLIEKAKKKAKREAVSSGTGTLGRMFILSKIASALKAFLAMFVNALAAVAQVFFGWLFTALMFIKGVVGAVLGFLGSILSGIGSFFGGIVSGIAGFLGVSVAASAVAFVTSVLFVAGTIVAAVVSAGEDNAIKEHDMTYASPTCAEQAYNAVFEAMEGDDGTFENQTLVNMKQYTSVLYEWSYKGLGDEQAIILISGMMGNCLHECGGTLDPSTIECGYEWNGFTLNLHEEPYVAGDKKQAITEDFTSYSYEVGRHHTLIAYKAPATGTLAGGDDQYYCHSGIWSATGPLGYNFHKFCKDNDLAWYSMDANMAWFLWWNEQYTSHNFKDWCFETLPKCDILPVDFSDSNALSYATSVFQNQWEGGNEPSNVPNVDKSRLNYAEKALPYVAEWIGGGDLDTAYAQSIIGLANSSAAGSSNDAVTSMMGDCVGFHAKYNNANLAAAMITMSYFDDYESEVLTGNPDYDIESGGMGWPSGEYTSDCYDSRATANFKGCTKTYIDVISSIEDASGQLAEFPETGKLYSSCDAGIATCLKWSGAYSDIWWYGPSLVGSTCAANPEQFDSFVWDKTCESLEPGDILYNNDHIWMFLGKGTSGGLVESKFHDRVSPDVYYIGHASRFDRGPKVGAMCYTTDSRTWYVVRCKKYEDNPKYTHVLDEQGAKEDVVDSEPENSKK